MNETAAARPARRVGTFTMGITLVLTGIVLILWLFYPAEWIRWALRLSPLILVALGAELLIFNARNPGGKLKYDVLSVLVCFLLICAAGAGSAGVVYLDTVVGTESRIDELTDAVRQDCRAALDGLPVSEVGVNYIHSDFLPPDLTAEEFKTSSHLWLYVSLAGECDADAFVKAAQRVAQALDAAEIRPESYRIQSRCVGGGSFLLDLDGCYAATLTADELRAMTDRTEK